MPHDRLRLPQRASRPGRSLRHEPCFKKRRKRRTSTKRRSRLSDRNKLPQTSNSLGLRSPHSPSSIRDTTSERINTRIRAKLPRPGRALPHRPRRCKRPLRSTHHISIGRPKQPLENTPGHGMGKPWANHPPRTHSAGLESPADLRKHLERKTGFEPATLTLANVRMTVQPVHELRLRCPASTLCPPSAAQSRQFVEWST